MSNGEATSPVLDRVPVAALIVGVAGLAGCALVALKWPYQFFPAYLVAFLFWVGLSLGSLAMTMLYNLVGGGWGVPLRRPSEAGAMTLPLMAALFVPITFGLQYLYPWANPSLAEQTKALLEAVHRKADYLKPSWFMIRSAGYFAIWIILAFFVTRWSVRQDTASDDRSYRWAVTISGPGLVLYFLAMSLASVDWIMSLEPDWASTIYGAMIVVGQGLLAFASLILVADLLSRAGALGPVLTRERVGDNGNLLLAFTMLWAYMAFSQFLIIWSGNLPDEIPWYLRRSRGGWQWVAITLVVFHFFAPFGVLLFRESKRRLQILTGVAVTLIAMHLLDQVWLVIPAPNDPLAPIIPWTKLAIVPLAWVGIGGVWVWWFALRLKAYPLVPVRDPAVLAALEHDGEH